MPSPMLRHAVRSSHLSIARQRVQQLHTTRARLAPGLFQGGGQSVGEDAADTSRKNAAVPFFVAAGAGIVGYVAYSQMSARQDDRESKKDAKHDQQKENIPAGSKERVGSRG